MRRWAKRSCTSIPRRRPNLDPDDLAERPAADSATEPEAVTRELEPHRLLHELFVAGLDAIDASLIDRVLARGADCAPLLLGVLNAYGEDLLHETDDGLVVRALALLGEIGDPAFLPALARFVPLEDDTIGGAARWAFLRIARQRPGRNSRNHPPPLRSAPRRSISPRSPSSSA